MTSTTTLTTAAPQPATLWRCGGRQCGAGECEHEDGELHRHAAGGGPAYAPPIVHDVLRASGTPLPAGFCRRWKGDSATASPTYGSTPTTVPRSPRQRWRPMPTRWDAT
jgi:hypothetical protein